MRETKSADVLAAAAMTVLEKKVPAAEFAAYHHLSTGAVTLIHSLGRSDLKCLLE